jgi:hypothetical protein
MERYLDDPNDPYISPGVRFSRQSAPSISVRWPVQAPKFSAASTATLSTRRQSDASSRRFSASSATSSLPPRNPPPPWHLAPANHGYHLPCGVFDCNLQFEPENWEAWISHSKSHFEAAHIPPPPQTRCPFCDGRDGFFEDFNDPHSNWRRRQIHVGGHFYNGADPQQSRPDYYSLGYMQENNIISCADLVSSGYVTPEMKKRERRRNEQPVNLEKERRETRKKTGARGHRDKGKGKEPTQEFQAVPNNVYDPDTVSGLFR